MDGILSILTSMFIALAVQTASGLSIVSISQTDFAENEDVGQLTVSVFRQGSSTGILAFTLTSLTYDEFFSRGYPLADEHERKTLPDPAENIENGRLDFVTETKRVEFSPESGTISIDVPFNVVVDDINEADEGFFIILSLDVDASDPASVQALSITRNTTLGIIRNDDNIMIGFNQRSFMVPEGNTTYDSLISVVLTGESELNLSVILDLPSIESALPGFDFNTGTFPQTLLFSPKETNISVPFSVLQDSIAENDENFRFFLTLPPGVSGYTVGPIQDTTVTIVDEDVLTFGFERSEYTVQEGNDSVEVCVAVSSPDEINITGVALLSTIDGTALASINYETVMEPVIFSANNVRSCRQISIFNQTAIQSSLNFSVQLTSVTSVRQVISRNTSTVTIGRIAGTLPPTIGTLPPIIDECLLDMDNCSMNAECIDTLESFSCNCNVGYTGNGVTCTDIDECAESRDNCHANAICRNTVGSFVCTCQNGFIGDGVNCSSRPSDPDIDECARSRDNCHADAICRNTVGSFECTCRSGFTGDGVNCNRIRIPDVLCDNEEESSDSSSSSSMTSSSSSSSRTHSSHSSSSSRRGKSSRRGRRSKRKGKKSRKTGSKSNSGSNTTPNICGGSDTPQTQSQSGSRSGSRSGSSSRRSRGSRRRG